MLRKVKIVYRFSSLIKQDKNALLDEQRRPPNYLADRKQLDEALNLNTHIFKLENVDSQVNSRFVAKSRVGMIREHAAIAFYNKMLRLKMSKGPLMNLLRKEVAKINDMKIEARPVIVKRSDLQANNKLGYEYLLQSSGYKNEINEFLQAEKNYYTVYLGSKLGALKLNYSGILAEIPYVYTDEKYFCDEWKYFNNFGSKLDIIKEPIWNAESLLKDDKENRKPVISNESLKEYFLDFKDDFSYFLCRYLKNNDIMTTDLRTIKVSEPLNLIAVKVLVDNNEILVIKRLDDQKYYMAYFPNEIDEFWLVKLKGLPSLVYKRPGSGSLNYMTLEDSLFSEIKQKNAAIKSIGEYMKANQDKLIENPSANLIEYKSHILFETQQNESTYLDYFGTNLFIKYKSSDSNINLWIITEDLIKMIFVS